MTVYQVMTRRIEVLLLAELACINAGSESMARTWRQHRQILQAKRGTMPISYASTQHDANAEVRRIVAARGRR
jgi:hypothetical protein